ncbi:MAG: prepilin-type N-terminal cleavage/methylation domain-containing protein [Bacilli bacterium]|jgi:prepilin-type N-terminal cleavage/methylation domain-containing protein|nr:prepilin-type N-terminal cleavage/methylation domain-containing protein [Bacilli bacterium]MCX4253834.1 prepilin-type N-terminal cleavage/methylation domain-containing protein [Bacilli bacterium]
MEKLNKKGFTLVELLSVIVILSVVVLIATNAVIPMMSNAKKQVLATEANTILGTAKSMYANDGASGSKCYSYNDVIKSGLITKSDEGYNGSFLIESNGNGGYNIKVWLSNGTNLIDGKSPDITSDDVIESSEEASTTCGKN